MPHRISVQTVTTRWAGYCSHCGADTLRGSQVSKIVPWCCDDQEHRRTPNERSGRATTKPGNGQGAWVCPNCHEAITGHPLHAPLSTRTNDGGACSDCGEYVPLLIGGKCKPHFYDSSAERAAQAERRAN